MYTFFMNKTYIFLSIIVIFLTVILFLVLNLKNEPFPTNPKPVDMNLNEESKDDKPSDENKNSNTQIANPASVYCEENGGKLEIRDTEEGQAGYCIFPAGNECEEWAYFRGECKSGDENDQPAINIEKDKAEIKEALIELRGDLFDDMEIVISQYSGKYAKGSVRPMQEDIGGGYLFAAKVDGKWKIVADGNGQINCDQLEPYPDIPVTWISACIDGNNNVVKR